MHMNCPNEKCKQRLFFCQAVLDNASEVIISAKCANCGGQTTRRIYQDVV